jgi:hypothetical protein
LKKLIASFFPDRRQAITFLVCLLLASVIWTINALNSTYSLRVRVPVVYGGRSIQAQDNLVHDLQLLVKGRGFDLIFFQRDAVRFRAEAGINPRSPVPVSSRKLVESLLAPYSRYVQLEDVHPEFIASGSAGLYSRKVPVTAGLRYSFKMPWVAAGPWVLLPDSVTVISTTPLPEHLNSIKVSTPDLFDLKKSYFGPVRLPKNQNGWMFEPSRIWLYVPAERGTEIKVMVPVQTSNPGAEILIPSKVELTLHVPLSKYESTNPGLFRVSVDNKSDANGKSMIRIDHVPYWASHVTVHPTSITRLRKVQ